MSFRHIKATSAPYAHIINTANSEWYNSDTTGFETFNGSNLADYAVAAGSQFGTTGVFPWEFPSGIAAGQYSVFVFDGDDDSLIEAGVVDWDGAALNVAADVRKVTGTAVANVDDFKATGFLTDLGTNAPANWINAAAIASSAITDAKIASNAITAAKIASNAITDAKINSGAITADKIASNAFTTAKFADGVFTAAKFASDFFSGMYDYFTGSSRADAFKATGFAVAGDEMDIVDAPNATAVSAIQSGLSTFNAASDQVIVATNNDKTGYALSAGGLASVTSWTVGITGNITGNLSGSVGSVTAAVETDSTSRTASKATATEIRTAIGLASANLDSQLGDIDTAADVAAGILATLTEDSSGLRFTEKALEEAPTGSGGGGDDAATIYSYFADGTRPNIFKADVSGLVETGDLPANFSALGINGSGHVSRVTLVDTTTENTDMVSPLDAEGTRTALGLPAADLGDRLDDIPTVAEFNARSLPSADYFVVGDYTVPPTAEEIAAASEVFDTSTVQDTAPKYSKATATMQQLNSVVVDGVLRIRKSDGSTMYERALTSEEDAEPVTGIGDMA